MEMSHISEKKKKKKSHTDDLIPFPSFFFLLFDPILTEINEPIPTDFAKADTETSKSIGCCGGLV